MDCDVVNAVMSGLHAPHVRAAPVSLCRCQAGKSSRPLSLAFPGDPVNTSHRGQAGLARHVGGDGRQGATPPAKLNDWLELSERDGPSSCILCVQIAQAARANELCTDPALRPHLYQQRCCLLHEPLPKSNRGKIHPKNQAK